MRCTLLVRFTNGGEWVSRSDVGSPSEQPDEGDQAKAAHSDALKRAAVQFGVGRYLYNLPNQWVDFDQQKKQLAKLPDLPEGCIPTAYRRCGPSQVRRAKELLLSCLRTIEYPEDGMRDVWAGMLAGYGCQNPEYAASMENRHITDIMSRLNVWTANIARNEPNVSESPLYDGTLKSNARPWIKADKGEPKREKQSAGR